MANLKYIKSALRPFYVLFRILINDLNRLIIHQYFPRKPLVINLNANDICNSKCVMCNIWEQKQDFEISPSQLESVLKDPLYSEVRHVGITGGEPTMRADIAQLYEAVCRALPSLTGVSIITNAIKEKEVIARIDEIRTVCDKYQIGFSLMVSLDGVGKVHDQIRRREGNFESAMKVINYYKQNTDIPVSIGCTISKNNVWDVDDMLAFLKENQLYGRFRVAEYINRLYNENIEGVIRNFTAEESFHLARFYKKLELSFETNETYQRTYRSIINQLLGKKRTIGCPYQAEGVVLNSRGEIQYCAPKSKTLGNALNKSSFRIFRKMIPERRRIIKEHCDHCIHDYHAEITFSEKLNQYKQIFWSEVLTIGRVKLAVWVETLVRLSFIRRQKGTTIFITGWYGTETTGDKAILGGILKEYQGIPDLKVIVSSMYPFVTEETLQELGIEADIVPTNSLQFAKAAAIADEVIMGGGPLMGMEALAIPLWAFEIAKRFGNKTTIFGCGIGPLDKQLYKEVVGRILTRADSIKLRDSGSVSLAEELSGRKDAVNIGDPAIVYLKSKQKEIQRVEKKLPYIVCFLREWTEEYKGTLTSEEFLLVKEKFEEQIAKVISKFCNEFEVTPVFYPMHTFEVGKDDRDFFRKFTAEHLEGLDYVIHRGNSKIDEILQHMTNSKFTMCMRFHSVLFAHCAKANFLALDYTNGGKIKGFLKDQNLDNKIITLHEMAHSNFEEIYEKFKSIFLIEQKD